MKLVTLVLLLALPCWGTITNVQHLATNANCSSSSGTTCSITVSSTTAGNAGFFCATWGGGTTPTSPGTGWVQDANVSNLSICWHNLSLTGGLTSIASTVASNNGRGASFMEWHTSLAGGLFGLDSANGTANSSQSNFPGQGLTLTHSTDVIGQFIGVSSGTATTGISAPYGDFTQITGRTTCAIADSLNTSSGTAPTWTSAATVATQAIAVALYETSPVGYSVVF